MVKETPKITSKKHLARLEIEQRQRKILRISAAVIIVLVLGVIIYGILDQTLLLANKPVAKVENEKITVSEFQKQVRYNRWQLINQYQSYLQIYQMFGSDPNYGASFLNTMQQIQAELDPAYASSIGENVLNQLINQKILKLEAEKRGITIADEEVQSSLQTSFNFFPEGTPIPTQAVAPKPTSTLSSLQLTLAPPTATATLSPTSPATATPVVTFTPTSTIDPNIPTATPFPTSTPYTEAGYNQAIADFVNQLSDFGFTEEDLGQLAYNNLLQTKIYDLLTADTPREQDQVWARHILLKDDIQAREVLKRLNNGESWASLASELSLDTSNKDNSGDLGWFGPGKMVAEFENTAFGLEIGEISEPVKSQFGFHIIQVLGHETRSLTEPEYESIRQAKYNDWIEEQKLSLNIQKFDRWSVVTPKDPTLPAEIAY